MTFLYLDDETKDLANKLGYTAKQDSDISILFNNDKGFFCLTALGGNDSVAESHSVYIYDRGKGHGKTQHKDRLALAKALGLQSLIATVRKDNYVERYILDQNKWTNIWMSVTPDTDLWLITL